MLNAVFQNGDLALVFGAVRVVFAQTGARALRLKILFAHFFRKSLGSGIKLVKLFLGSAKLGLGLFPVPADAGSAFVQPVQRFHPNGDLQRP